MNDELEWWLDNGTDVASKRPINRKLARADLRFLSNFEKAHHCTILINIHMCERRTGVASHVALVVPDSNIRKKWQIRA